jgi:hypothetical protein
MRASTDADGAVRRLVAEFSGVHSAATVAAVVDEAVTHLTGQVSPAALPELLERLARHRLVSGLISRSTGPVAIDPRRVPRRRGRPRRACLGVGGRRQGRR